ncbi:glycerate kinase [Aureimonas flava]|uniref:Glycerate kinase n=1 Tax=Aureimonas flava TaxID=2320271 RepID=A0A3A1WVZ4_9HYPH|nr:glycerate kinase [Aureimonas flava]RIY02528.1 glycerate kinase [Aureimonas flava]
MGETEDGRILQRVFGAALGQAMPAGRFAGRLPERPRGRTLVLGAGKAAASMAAAFEAEWDGPCEGLVVTRYGHGVPTRRIEVVEASHPVPDAAGEAAARRILDLARGAGADDLVVVLISGGASSLLALPAPGVTLADKQAVNRALLLSGAPIGEMNTVRKALSAIKGGRLAAAAAPARLVTYAISDVPGDDPGTIGSGPTVRDARGAPEALAILARRGIGVDAPLRRAVEANAASAPQDDAGVFHMLATPMMALEAGAEAARALGLEPVIWGDAIEGEARAVGAEHARRALAAPPGRPTLFISGGETTVTVGPEARGGRGGRNSEYLLSLAVALDGRPGVSAIACDTDGIDGSESNAGAWFDPSLTARARAAGIDLAAHLDAHDAFTPFERLDRLVVTGPTFTNVNDFRAILVRGGW